MKKIQVEKQDIRVALFNDQEYICLTDMMPSKDGEFFVSDGNPSTIPLLIMANLPQLKVNLA
jgi:hypothetical protein